MYSIFDDEPPPLIPIHDETDINIAVNGIITKNPRRLEPASSVSTAHLIDAVPSKDNSNVGQPDETVCDEEKEEGRPSSSRNSATFRMPRLSREWIICPYEDCDYKSHRPDFFKIHMDRFHMDDDEAINNHLRIVKWRRGLNRRRIESDNSSSSETEQIDDSSSEDSSTDAEGLVRKCPSCKKFIDKTRYITHVPQHGSKKFKRHSDHPYASMKRCVYCNYTSRRAYATHAPHKMQMFCNTQANKRPTSVQ